MGVAGSGKSSIGSELSARLDWPFLEGDSFHSAQNKAKMESGIALTDEDRWPWLEAIAAELNTIDAAGGNALLACSALRRVYRDRLRMGTGDLCLVHLHGDTDIIAERIKSRTGHYMPPSLLKSQLDTLESPEPDEDAITIDIARPVSEIAAAVIQELHTRFPQSSLHGI